MRRAAISSHAITLPSRPAALEIVAGRQRLVRRQGIFFALVARHRRAVYEQIDGKLILADECTCAIDWPEPWGELAVRPSADCPIDEHQILTRSAMGDD